MLNNFSLLPLSCFVFVFVWFFNLLSIELEQHLYNFFLITFHLICMKTVLRDAWGFKVTHYFCGMKRFYECSKNKVKIQTEKKCTLRSDEDIVNWCFWRITANVVVCPWFMITELNIDVIMIGSRPLRYSFHRFSLTNIIIMTCVSVGNGLASVSLFTSFNAFNHLIYITCTLHIIMACLGKASSILCDAF